MSILGVASIAYSGNAHLGVTAPVPMDDEHCLISGVINVDHHFLNENPCKPLLRAYIGARRIPYRWQVVSKGHQGGPVNLWTGSCTRLQTGDAMFQATRSSAAFQRASSSRATSRLVGSTTS